MVYNQLEHSNISINSHDLEVCAGSVCAFHNRTDHHMRKFRQFYRLDRNAMERICGHGVGHPDPDDIDIVNGKSDGIHDCDACCIRFATQDEYDKAMGIDD